MQAPITATPLGLSIAGSWTRRRLAVGLAVGAATLAALALVADVSLLASAGARLLREPWLLLVFLAAYGSAFALRAHAWALLAPGLGRRNAFAILHASLFANHVAPVKVGEVVRPILAAKHGLSPADAVTTSLATRLFDVLSLTLITVVLVPFGSSVSITSLSAIVALPLALVGLAIVGLLLARPALRRAPTNVVRAAEAFSESARSQSPARSIGAAGLTLPSWVLEGAVAYIAALSLGVSVSPEAAVAATAFTLMFQMLHVTPGGIGVYEASMTGGLVAFGVSPAEAFAVATLAHGLKFGYSFTFGLALTATMVRPAGWANADVRRGHLLSVGVFITQVALVVGYFNSVWSVATVATVDAVLFATATLAVLGRQWHGAWRPMCPATVVADDARPVVLVVPAFNEERALPLTLARVPRDVVQRIVVVDDGSLDGTAKAAEAAGADLVVRHDHNRGLGAALRTALDAAKTFDPKAVVYVDADGEYDPAEAGKLLAPILSGEADYVLGSRALGGDSGQVRSRKLGNAVFTTLLAFAAGRRFSDGQTGFRAFSPRALAAAEIVHDYNYAQVLTLDLLRKRMRLREVPVTWSRRTVGISFVRLEYLWRVPLGMLRQLFIA